MQIEVVCLHFIRANGGFEYVQLDTSFKSTSDGGEWSVSHAGRIPPGKELPMNTNLCGAQGRSSRLRVEANRFPLPGFYH